MSRQVYKSPVTHPGWKNPGSVAEIFHRTRIAFGKVGSFGSDHTDSSVKRFCTKQRIQQRKSRLSWNCDDHYDVDHDYVDHDDVDHDDDC